MLLPEINNKSKIGLITAICLIVANMIGVGVFTSLGYQVVGTHSIFAILTLWIVGGAVALCGALTYGELAVAMPRSGGEYNYLSKIYHPAIGFLSGWVSCTVGFAAPMAMMAVLFGHYFENLFPGLNPQALGIILVAVLTLINISSFKAGSSFQTFFTLLNIVLIIFISIAGYFLADHAHFLFTVEKKDFIALTEPAFGHSLVYVSFAYSGWNSATYIAGEIRNPFRNLPKALFIGTAIVTILYLLLNFIFLYAVPMNELAGQVEVAFIAAVRIFGPNGGIIISIVISIALVASANSMMITGPRVTKVIGEDFSFFKMLAKTNHSGTPIYATLIQSVIAILLIYFSKFESIMPYIGFTLSLFIMLTVAGVFVNRLKYPDQDLQYRTWGFPFIPIIFILLEGYMVVRLFAMRWEESLYGTATVLSGLVIYYFVKEKNNPSTRENN
jgi:basic amino acid/polyamine antiporter, APA family